jgi:hypothetical protein
VKESKIAESEKRWKLVLERLLSIIKFLAEEIFF